MSRITRFEDIDAWKKARELSREVYTITRVGEFARDFGLRDQIRRAAVSVMSNIAEGYERDGNSELRQFLYVAKGSAGEVRSQLYVALDAGHIDEPTFNRLTGLALDTTRLIRGFIRYLDQSGMDGPKFS
ncbi:MAG TPA: four helix bundle protein [Fimbriiglobus sp.]|nr:four helix bundle protein [Fimbriiglobus sp.]